MCKDFEVITIVVPCRNEGEHIESCVRSIFDQDVKNRNLEIIVVDGMSNDGTREILERLMAEDSRLKVIDNKRQITPCARNLGINEAKGSLIAIFDAHTVYDSHYLSACLDLLNDHQEICCAGGPINSVGKSVFGRTVAAAMSNPLGVGNAKHRFPEYEGYAEGACFPVFRREIFEKVGLFDESLIRNQDDEFNFRIALNGAKIFLSPRAKCTYYVRETPSKLFWQFFQYGYYRVAVLRKHRLPISLRHFAPVGFFLVLIILFLASFPIPRPWSMVGYILPLGYWAMLSIGGLWLGRKEGIFVGLLFPLVAFIMHFAYALGFAAATVKPK